MTTTPWHAGLETGIVELDKGNRSLVEHFAALEAADDATRLAACAGLEAAMYAHFAEEELLMQGCGYEMASHHCSEHAWLLGEIRQQMVTVTRSASSASRASSASKAAAMISFIARWFGHHILTLDADLGRALHARKGVRDRQPDGAREALEVSRTPLVDQRKNWTIAWSQKLALGVDVIDADHRALTELYNRIASPEVINRRDLLPPLLGELGKATAAHFAREEALMADHHYAGIAEHRAQHARLLDEFGEQIDDWYAHRVSSATMVRFLYTWLLRHIVTYDVPLATNILARQ